MWKFLIVEDMTSFHLEAGKALQAHCVEGHELTSQKRLLLNSKSKACQPFWA